MGDLRADYLGVHLSIFEKIAAGERDGWSDRDEVDGMIAEIDWALSTTGGILEAHHRLLELGCGDGCLTVRLAGKHPCAVHGIDIVPLAIELAAKRAAAEGVIIHLQAGNVTGLPWPESCFDVVVDGHCLHCVVLDDRQRCLAEAYRVLRPGGVLVVITMVGEPAHLEFGCFDAANRHHVYDNVAGRHFGTLESIRTEIKRAGFTIAAERIWQARHDRENDDLVVAAVKQD